MTDAYLVFRLDQRPTETETRLISDRELEDTIDEDDAQRFREYSVAGDYYEYGNLVVVRLGRRFTATGGTGRD
jgi:hypothetical protein